MIFSGIIVTLERTENVSYQFESALVTYHITVESHTLFTALLASYIS